MVGVTSLLVGMLAFWASGSNGQNSTLALGSNGVNITIAIGSNAANSTIASGSNVANSTIASGSNTGNSTMLTSGSNEANITISSGSNMANSTMASGSNGININIALGSNDAKSTMASATNMANSTISSESNVANITTASGSNTVNSTMASGSNGININIAVGSNEGNSTMTSAANMANSTISSGSTMTGNTMTSATNMANSTMSSGTDLASSTVGSGSNGVNITLTIGSNTSGGTMATGSNMSNSTMSSTTNTAISTMESATNTANSTIASATNTAGSTMSSATNMVNNTMASGSNGININIAIGSNEANSTMTSTTNMANSTISSGSTMAGSNMTSATNMDNSTISSGSNMAGSSMQSGSNGVNITLTIGSNMSGSAMASGSNVSNSTMSSTTNMANSAMASATNVANSTIASATNMAGSTMSSGSNGVNITLTIGSNTAGSSMASGSNVDNSSMSTATNTANSTMATAINTANSTMTSATNMANSSISSGSNMASSTMTSGSNGVNITLTIGSNTMGGTMAAGSNVANSTMSSAATNAANVTSTMSSAMMNMANSSMLSAKNIANSTSASGSNVNINIMVSGTNTASMTSGSNMAKSTITASLAVLQTAADDLKARMNTSIDPCTDFYQYACGGWIKNNPIPKSRSSINVFDIVSGNVTSTILQILTEMNSKTDPIPLVNARDMYAACMDTQTIEKVGLQPLTDYLTAFGGWPMAMSNWAEKDFDWRSLLASAINTYGFSYLLSISNDLDSNNTNQSVIYVDQGSLTLPRPTLCDLQSSPNITQAYKDYMLGSAKAVRDFLKSGVTDAQIMSDVQAVLNFESRLACLTVPDENRRNNTAMYNPMALKDLQSWTDSAVVINMNVNNSSLARVDWLKLLNDIYSAANITIPSDERVVVVEKNYLRDLIGLLNRTPPRVLANYLLWRLVSDLGSDTTQRMLDLQFNLYKVMDGVSEPIPRSGACADQVSELMGWAVGAKYVEKAFNDSAKLELKTMIANLKQAFKCLVYESDWMDCVTKSIAYEKVDAMVEFIAYPDWIKNKTALEDYYDGIEVSRTTHFENVQMASSFVQEQSLSSLRDKTDRTAWDTFPTVVNSFYSEVNSITFPAGILQPPFYTTGSLAAINYGAIGSVIGHEITHGFDDQGRQSDKFGNTVQWWSAETLRNYMVRAQCFVDQYSNFTIPSGTRVNGINTEGENIADNGGLREALRAYRYYVAANGAEPPLPGFEQFSAEKIFFLSYASNWCGAETPEGAEDLILTDPHSPSRSRVNGPLSNNEDFVREFKCPVSSPMNRMNKCVLW